MGGAIRFTAEVSNEEHELLDTKSRLVGNNIDVDLYTKPTDTVGYENHKTYLRTPYQNPYQKCFGEVGIQKKGSKME